MLEAFRRLGYDVVEVTGHSRDRLPLMRSLRRDIRQGRHFELCYAECVNSPTALSDPSHLPLHPLADPLFFRALRTAGTPTAMFYRDVHWRFDQYREVVSPLKRLPAELFYRFDLAWYARLVDILYVPDLGMSTAVPGHQHFDVRPLPPGTVPVGSSRPPRRHQDPLRLVYIGSVTPPHNDITPLLRSVASTPGARLTVSCPRSEAQELSRYPSGLTDGVVVEHLTGTQVDDLYRDADVACLVYEPHPYRGFAMPVKLFEAIGHGVPCIVDDDTAAGRFVARNGFGWAVRSESDLRDRLRALLDDPEEVRRVGEHTLAGAGANTWTVRAGTVVADLAEKRSP
jgi:glycosyltransferase involved in cell wall biosynthesis